MDEIERLKIYVDFYKDCLDRLLKMYPDPKAKEMYELGVKDGADLAWMHGSDATAQELEKAYFQGMEDAMKEKDVQVVKHGRWKFHPNGSATCSICGFYQKDIWDLDDWQNYCGVCGARMDGVVK